MKNSGHVENKTLVWDCIKCEIRGITISYCIKKAKEKRHYETKLRSDFKILEEKIDNNEDVHDMYNTVQRELEEIEEDNLRGKNSKVTCTMD